MLMRFKALYSQVIVEKLQTQFAYRNKHQIAKLEKIVINMGVGEAVSDSKVINNAVNDLTLISGQKPYVTKAKKSIATFKSRTGMKLGCKVTLRGDRMYHFLERLVLVGLPRIRGFTGLSSKSFDGHGNFSFGIPEQTVFPEIDYDKIDKIRGMDVTIVTSAKTNKEGQALLEGFNLPFYN
jgi:large subunit ribosomal protein L5